MCRKGTGSSCSLASNFTMYTMYMGLEASATVPSNLELLLFLSPSVAGARYVPSRLANFSETGVLLKLPRLAWSLLCN